MPGARPMQTSSQQTQNSQALLFVLMTTATVKHCLLCDFFTL